MKQTHFRGALEFPLDKFSFNELAFFINYDKKEVIEQWSYESADGIEPSLEQVGAKLIGLTLLEAFKLSGTFQGKSQAIYWQLGRLLGYWPNHCYENLICRCFGVTKEQIGQVLIGESDISLSKIRASTKASAGCGSCANEVKEILQEYCDQHALKNGGALRPKGLTPIDFFLAINQFFTSWQSENQFIKSLQFQGVDGYDIFASWSSKDDELVSKFQNDLTKSIKIKTSIKRTSY